MTTANALLPEMLVDGQVVLVPDKGGWDALRTAGALRGMPIYSSNTEKSFNWTLDFVSHHDKYFRCGLYRAGPALRNWTLLVLMEMPGGLQRVHLERLTCEVCQWKGIAANPTLPELYFGVADEPASVKRALALQRVVCQVCGAELPRPAIWVEQKE